MKKIALAAAVSTIAYFAATSTTGRGLITAALQRAPIAQDVKPLLPILRDFDGQVSERDPRYAAHVQEMEDREWEDRQNAMKGTALPVKTSQASQDGKGDDQPVLNWKDNKEEFKEMIRQAFGSRAPFVGRVFLSEFSRLEAEANNEKIPAPIRARSAKYVDGVLRGVAAVSEEFIREKNVQAVAALMIFGQWPLKDVQEVFTKNPEGLLDFIVALEKLKKEMPAIRKAVGPDQNPKGDLVTFMTTGVEDLLRLSRTIHSQRPAGQTTLFSDRLRVEFERR